MFRRFISTQAKQFIHLSSLRRYNNMSLAPHEEVLEFWFGKGLNGKLWFGGGADQDKLIKDKFGDLVVKARNGELSTWENLELGNRGGLAFVILIDQFCRNIYRGHADTFSHDHVARAVAQKEKGISQGVDVKNQIVDGGKYKELSIMERAFLYLPFEHGESKELQDQSVKLFAEIVEDAKTAEEALQKAADGWLDFAKQHQDVIAKFGRFPKRNKALGRENTKEEEEFFKGNEYTF